MAFWRQFNVAKQIVGTGEARVLQRLEPWLTREDRHSRGNAAFVFASLGDARGLETIRAMLTDRSARSEGQGIPVGKFSLAGQIRADRYYAAPRLSATARHSARTMAAAEWRMLFATEAASLYGVSAAAVEEVSDGGDDRHGDDND